MIIGQLLPIFLILKLFSVIFMFCNIAFEQDNLDLPGFINAVVIIIID